MRHTSLSFALLFVLFSISMSAAEQLPWPKLINPESGLYVTRFADPKIKLANLPYPQKVMYYEMGVERNFSLAPFQSGSRPGLRIQVESRQGSNANALEITELERENGGALWTFYSKTLKDKSGKVMGEEKYYPRSRELGYPNDVYNNIAMTALLRVLVNSPKGQQYLVQLWVTPQMAFQIRCVIGNTESVQVPAGTFNCVRMDIKPTVFDYFGNIVSKLVAPFVPNTTIWYENSGAYRMIKMDGMMQQSPALDIPNVIMELKK